MSAFAFTVYPAIDLRGGQVVRLLQGDPERKTVYGNAPAEAARRWLEAGATWLHVINLDGAFGEPGAANQAALGVIAREVARHPGKFIQFGGGLRTSRDVEQAFASGANRVVLGTLAAEQLDLVAELLDKHGPDRVALGIDVRGGRVRTRGWLADSGLEPAELGRRFHALGGRICIYTNIDRDGSGQGIDLEAVVEIARLTGLETIASGGAASLEDVRRARQAGLSGIILGRVLYEGRLRLEDAVAV